MSFKTCTLIAAMCVLPSLVLAEGPDPRRSVPQTNIPMEVQQQPSVNLQNTMFDYDLYTFAWQLKYKMLVHMPSGQTHVQYYNTIDAWEAGYESWYELRSSPDHYNPPAAIEGPFAENVKVNVEFVQRFDTHAQASAAAQALEQDGFETEIQSVQVQNVSQPQFGGSRRGRRN